MSAGIEQEVAPDQINQLLSVVFLEMSQLGELRQPFQDVVQFPAPDASENCCEPSGISCKGDSASD